MKIKTRAILLMMLMTLCVLLNACKDNNSRSARETKNTKKSVETEESVDTDEDRDYIFYSEITDEDWETIGYVNENSDYYFTLMEKMDEESCIPFPDAVNLYGEENEDLNVDSQGVMISSEDAIFRYAIFLRDPSDYHILGIHQGDTYKEAKDLCEAAGFVWSGESPLYGERTETVYSKGNVQIRVDTFDTEEEGMDSDKIDSINVIILIVDESYEPSDGIP